MPESTLPPLTGKATLDVSAFSQGIGKMQADLRAVRDLARQVGTLKITADLSAGRDVQRQVRAIRDAVQESIPSDMQRRISDMFGGFALGANAAKQSASVFEAQAAAIRARIDELDRAVRITRANFQAGFGEASPEEIGHLTAEMARLQNALKEVGDTARQSFGEYSREAQKVANANRLAEATASAARGEISRLGLASQVKLGTSAALAQYGPQAMGAANGLFQFAQASDKARIAQGLFNKTIEKTGGSSEQASQTLARLQDTLGVSADQAMSAVRGLLRQGYSLGQAYTALEGAGASALAAGRSAAEGMDAYVDAVTAGESARLNDIGISENLSTFYQKEARARGTTVDAMTRQQKVQAELALVTAATKDEVGDLNALMSGLSGNVSSANRELNEATKALGEKLVPLATNGARALTRVLEVFTALPQPIQTTVTLLGASAVAVGILSGPVSALARGYTTIRDGLKGVKAASDGLRAGATATAEASGNLAESANTFTDLAAKARGFYASASARLATWIANTLLASGATNVLSVAFLRTAGSTTILSGALGTLTLASAAALAGIGALTVGLGALWANQVRGTTEVYEQVDQANQAVFEKTMARVRQLNKSGTELGRAQAKVLLLQQQLLDAQQGPLMGVNALTGERIYGKPDEARIKQLQADLVAARENVTLLYTEAQRRGRANVVLTEDQTKAVKDLRQALEGKAFELRLKGMTDLQADLARLGKDYEDLRVKFKQPFIVKGKLLDPAQTPALREGLADLDAQQAAAEAATRKKYADDAAKAAREAALTAQKAEIDAMAEGQAKRHAQRQAELDEIRRETAEKVKALADFPKQQKALEAAARQEIAAKRKGWTAEDQRLARESAQKVAEAEKSARDGVISAMRDGYAKEEATRHAALEDLKAAIAERVRALAGDPSAQAGVRAAGAQQLAALQQQQDRERERSAEEAGKRILEAERSSRDARIAAMEDGYAKEEATRQAALADLRENIRQQVQELQGYPDQQAAVLREGNRQILALEQQQGRERKKAREDALKTVLDAEKTARDASIAAIADETARRRAQRDAELADLQQQTREKLKTFQGTEQERQRIQDAARQEQRAKQQQWAQEDARDAKERAQRIAKAWQDAQDAEFAAQQAGRSNQAAQDDLDMSRRLQAARDRQAAGNTGAGVEAAQIEMEAVGRRAQFAEAQAQKQAAQDRKRLEDARDLALDNDKLSATERQAIWAKYYADLAALDGKEQADHKQRLQQREEAERLAAENLRRARIDAAQQPATDAESRAGRLENAKGTTLTDAGLLALEQQISAEREQQLTTYRAMLEPTSGLKLTAQERKDIEGKIADLQQQQLRSQQDQVEQARALRQSALDRLDAEAQYAEKVAGSDAARARAQTQQLAVARARLSELDDLIAAEGREKERNDLISQRYGLLGQIAELQDKINAAPFDAEQRRIDLYRAQAQAQLALKGLGDDRVAQADLTAQIAARELLLANSRVAAARNELELQAALSGQAQARLALVQALTGQAQAGREATRAVEDRAAQSAQSAREAARAEEDLAEARARSAREAARAGEDLELARRQATVEAAKRQLDLENSLWDASEARARALTQIRGLADDAVASAEQDLAFTRERLALAERQLGTEDLGSEARAELDKARLSLLGQQAEQERKLLDARRAQRDLAEELTLAEGRLNRELTGGNLSGVAEATRKVAEARQTLTTAERAYAEARSDYERIPSSTNAGRLKAATDALTGAIQGQRSAVHALADEYRNQISGMDGVREASDRLRQVAYGDNQPFNSQTERQRLLAIQARRDAAQQSLRDALASGDAASIQKATEDLARQEERYKKQADLLEKNGVKFTRTGEAETRRLADQVDALGIQYDREAVLLGERARQTDREAEAALTFSSGVDRFADSTAQLVAALDGAYQDLRGALEQVKAERDADAARQNGRREEDARTAAEDRARQDRRREEDAALAAVDRARQDLRREQDASGVGGLPQGWQNLDRVAGSLAASLGPLAPGSATGGFAAPITLSPDTLRELAAGLGQAFAARPQPAFPATQPVHTVYNTTEVGGITIYQQPGESADALANRVISKLEDRVRRAGKRC